MKNSISKEAQKERREKLMQIYLDDIKNQVLADGTIVGFFDDRDGVGERETMWVAYSLLFDDDAQSIKKANLIIQKVGLIDGENDYTSSHFTPMTAAQMIIKHKDKLEDETYRILYTYLERSLPHIVDNPEFEFVGVNDNFPCMATFMGIVGGTILGNAEIVDWGVRNLKSLIKLLKRRGLPSENTSNTYTPDQIMPIAEVVTYAPTEEIRELALYAERRLTISALGFYHRNLGKVCGPYSRAYRTDSTLSIYIMGFWLYSVLGDKMPVSSIDEMFVEGKINKIIDGSRWFETVQFIWLAQCEYHVTEKTVNEALNRKFPYEIKATCEYSSSRDDVGDGETDVTYAASDNEVNCYMTEEYAVGVSKVPFHNGIQTDSFHLGCRKCENVTHSKDVQAVYMKYLINDTSTSLRYFDDRGRKIGLMNKNMGFIGYRPTKRIVGSKVSSMKLSIIIPQVYGKGVEIVRKGTDSYIRIYKTYIAFYAMNNGGDIKIEEKDDFTLISLYNYEGAEKELTYEDYYAMVNGVLFAVADESECTFEEFMSRDKIIKERLFKSSHSRQTLLRNVYFEYEGKSIEIEYDVEGCGVKYSLRDGELAENTYYYDSVNGYCDDEKLRRIVNE